VIPGGEYAARITDVKEKLDGEFGPAFAIEFTLQEGKVGHKITKFCSQKFSPKSRLFELAKAVRGTIPKTYNLDTDDLLGEDVVLSVVKEMGEQDEPFNKIVGFLPKASRAGRATNEGELPPPPESPPDREY
jgi:hypothetical protein